MVNSLPAQAAIGGTVIAVTQAPLPSILQIPIFGYPLSDYIAIITFLGFLISVGLSIRKNLKK